MKAQTEIIIILSMVVVSATVVFLVSQTAVTKPVPSEIGELKNLLKADVERALRSYSIETVLKIAKQGGYRELPANSVDFQGNRIPYWSICQNKINVPPMEKIVNNIKIEMEKRLEGMDINGLKAKYGKQIEIVNATRDDMEVLVRERDVVFDITMPTKMEGFEIQQPYRIVIPLALGLTYDFSSKFIENTIKERHFENFITSLFYHSNQDVFPVLKLLTKCGESVFRTYDQLKTQAEKIVDFATDHFIFWRQPPPENQRQYLERYVPDLEGKKYPSDLIIEFSRAANLDRNSFQSSKNPVSVINSKVVNKIIPKCLTPVDVEYSLMVPIVATAKVDNLEFNFAMWPFIDRNAIGNCKVEESTVDEAEDVCAEKECRAKIIVKNSEGDSGIKRAEVYFGTCHFGRTTNSTGIVEGNAPCGVSELTVRRDGYSQFYDLVSTAGEDGKSFLDKTVVLKKSPFLNFHFDKVASVSGRPTSLVGIMGGSSSSNNDIGVHWYDTSVKTIPTGGVDIYVTLKPKNLSPWMPLEFVVSNVVQEDSPELPSIKTDEPPKEEKIGDLRVNIKEKYKDGSVQERNDVVITGPEKIYMDGRKNDNHKLIFPITNSQNQNLVGVEVALRHSIGQYIILGSETSTATGLDFSTKTEKIGKVPASILSWTDKTKEGFLKPGESATFTVTLDMNKYSETKILAWNIGNQKPASPTPTPAKKESAKNKLSEQVDFIPPGVYDVEVRAMKDAHYYNTVTISYPDDWYDSFGLGDEKEETYTIDEVLKVVGVSNFEFEIKESDKEIYITPLIPSFYEMPSSETEYDYSDVLGPTAYDKAKVEPYKTGIKGSGIQSVPGAYYRKFKKDPSNPPLPNVPPYVKMLNQYCNFDGIGRESKDIDCVFPPVVHLIDISK